MGDEDNLLQVRRTKKVRVLGKYKIDFFNGSGDHCQGKCECYRGHISPNVSALCGGRCHLAIKHDGPCVCGNPVCRQQRLYDWNWLKDFLSNFGVEIS